MDEFKLTFFISFLDFQNNVMESCSSDTRGLDETVFQTPSLLHLTIGTLALMDEIERKKAKEILESAIEEFKVAKKLSIEIKGLEIMNDDPGEVDVVYAKVNDCDELQTLADGIVSKFTETGIHCAFSSSLFHGQIAQIAIHQLRDPESKKCSP